MKKSIRNIIIGAIVIVSISSMIYSKLKPLEVDGFRVEARDLYDYVEENGKVISENEVVITPKITAQVIERVKRNGDSVQKGDLILKLDSESILKQMETIKAQMTAYDEEKNSSLSVLKNQIASQSIQVNESKSKRDFAKNLYDQMTVLYEDGSLSENEWKTSKQTYETAESTYRQMQSSLNSLNAQYKNTTNASGTLEALKSQYATLELQLNDCNVVAGADGLLTEFDVKKGEMVSQQMPVGKIIDPSSYSVETYVLTDDISNLNVDDEVVLILKENGIENEFKGQIEFIAKSAEEKISSLGLIEQRIKVLIQSEALSEEVKAGYEVKVKFISEYKKAALAVPKTSIFKIEGDSYVYAVRAGRATQLKIETGIDTDSEFAVESGIDPGEIIIKNYKLDGLMPDKKVTVSNIKGN
ncbi:efflux RND transporter periplasmic adaptor subunit [Fusibacter ferrireducens]|uniref:HlyD family efflux transporter periplasmic adaptor subunit n=1 Tax=Fusibacter ferrireducens TaxID=2785058 RepID=A0ABR9ZQQ0_9FIRM|nr:HlyD family efflux transporter periplasmic adaptor subunit [Fusibacter ferrireducens]MBF4692773.1 HlyD family efflux transporter periplasmic adaptor subunit [Fusibacter ferrireducens]